QYTNQYYLLIDLESQGRTLTEVNLDISRTVGWFTNIYPVLLDLNNTDEISENIKTIKEQLRQAQKHSFEYGIVRYLQDNLLINKFPAAPISFNYLGQFDNLLAASSFLKLAEESTGLNSAAENKISHAIAINSSIVNGQLKMQWSYDSEKYQEKTIVNLADSYISKLQQIITHCQTHLGSYTPSDFSLAESELEQDTIDSILDMVDFSDR
ncbi:MAG: condensation domain-containing protein, partial [Cyanobacteria bacterium J06600_6]